VCSVSAWFFVFEVHSIAFQETQFKTFFDGVKIKVLALFSPPTTSPRHFYIIIGEI
jgi:hypothetical protein